MTVEFTHDAELARQKEMIKARERGTWEHLKTTNLVKAAKAAKAMNWKENKVMVRATQTGEAQFEYTVEPYDNCGCPNVLKYSDFFD